MDDNSKKINEFLGFVNLRRKHRLIAKHLNILIQKWIEIERKRNARFSKI